MKRWRRPSTREEAHFDAEHARRSRRGRSAAASPSHTENTMISMSPTQNVGRLKPEDRARHDRFRRRGCRACRPAQRPSGRPSTIAITIARQRELDGRRHALEDEIHRRHVRRERAAELAAERAREEIPVLHRQRLVEPERRGRARDLGLVGLRVDEDVDRVADRVDAREDERRHDEQHERALRERGGEIVTAETMAYLAAGSLSRCPAK